MNPPCHFCTMGGVPTSTVNDRDKILNGGTRTRFISILEREIHALYDTMDIERSDHLFKP